MEFFLPSLLLLIFSAIVVFYIFPYFAPIVLVIIAFLALILAILQNLEMFSADYKMMTWQEGAAAAAPYLLSGFAIIYLFSFILGIYGRTTKSKQPTRYSNISRRGRYADTPFVY
jgi:hypothetical protein